MGVTLLLRAAGAFFSQRPVPDQKLISNISIRYRQL
jgi:hypothetical protein